MFWNKKPNTGEQAEIGEKVGRYRSTVNIVMQRLLKDGLMAEEIGSVRARPQYSPLGVD